MLSKVENGKIFVVKRWAGVEQSIPVWNLGGFIETPVGYSDSLTPERVDILDAALSLQQV